jgi:hypothetical protein
LDCAIAKELEDLIIPKIIGKFPMLLPTREEVNDLIFELTVQNKAEFEIWKQQQV